METLGAKKEEVFEGLKNANGPELLKMMADNKENLENMNNKLKDMIPKGLYDQFNLF